MPEHPADMPVAPSGWAVAEPLGVGCIPDRVGRWNGHSSPDPAGASVVYWMMHAQRGMSNLAVDAAVDIGNTLGLPVACVFSLGRGPRESNIRHVDFMLRGLPDVAADLADRNVSFHISAPGESAVDAIAGLVPAVVVLDEDAMAPARRARGLVAAALDCPVISIDADVIVPQRRFAKAEYAARTIRPKVHAAFDAGISDTAHDRAANHGDAALLKVDAPALVEQVVTALGIDRSVPPVDLPSGRAAALSRLDAFVRGGLREYDTARNHPDQDGTSLLSPYLHYGHLSVHEIVAAASAATAPREALGAFIEELVVRRELAINWVRHTPNYDSIEAAEPWAATTLADHASDPREWIYDAADLTEAVTHDPLWNAAQRQMMETGHMHGYIRMYWAKKILEWSPSPAEAYRVALALNDRWSLDGRDPNGVVGVAWAIAGVHDRAWGERPIFGKIRYMSLASTGRKFRSRDYIARWCGDAADPAGARLF